MKDAVIHVALGILAERRPPASGSCPAILPGRLTRKDGKFPTENPWKNSDGDWPWWILITKRPANTVYGGYWELPGGKIEPGETPKAALVGEFKEELGLVVRAGGALDEVEHTYAHARVRLRPFFCSRVATTGLPNEPCNLAVAEHRWILPDQVNEFHFPEANTSILAQMLTMIPPPESLPESPGRK